MEHEDESLSPKSEFYSAAAKYWDGIPATVDGMLGGFGFISQTDIKGSSHFLKTVFELQNPPMKSLALDCGAGIGRITKNLLMKHFKQVDMVEQNPKFLQAAKTYLDTYAARLGQQYAVGLQDFCPTAKKYDVIWCQWVLGHLKDDDLVNFFKNCASGLKDNGVLVVKENVTSTNKLEIDTEDSSVTRPLKELKFAFEKADLTIVKEQRQEKLPRGLYPVYMFALRLKNPCNGEVLNNG